MTNANKHYLKTLVRGAYDIQKLRIQTGNRLVANFKAKLGQEPSHSEDEIDQEGKQILKDLRQVYDKLTDGVASFPRQASFKGNEVISSYTELCLVSQYVDLEQSEEKHFRHLTPTLREFPVFTEFLEGVKGVGPAMAGVIISEIDIEKAKYPSSLWAYAGLDVASNGAGRSRKKEHLHEVEYVDKNGNKATRVGITFNPFLKTKLIGVLGSSFLRSGRDGYADYYYNYKNRIENHPAHKEKTKLHRHNMAVRYMVKRFLVDLYTNWRALEGLEVSPEYNEAKLGHNHNREAS